MSGLATFQPAQSPATSSELGLQAQNDTQSWMNQSLQRQIQQAQAQRAQTEFALALPALAAKGNADLLAAQNEAASATLQQQLRGQWQSLKPQVVADLANIVSPGNQPKQADGTPDWNAIYNQYEGLQAKYSALDLLPEGKAYYQQIEQGKKDAFQRAMSHEAAQMMINQIKMRGQTNLGNQEALAQTKADLEAKNKPAIAQAEAINAQRNQEFARIQTQRGALRDAAFDIENTTSDIEKEGSSALGSGPFVGSPMMAAIRSSFGDPSASQVQADIGSFAPKIMSMVKNIRNQAEFAAVTASIPKASDPLAVQKMKIARLREMNVVLTQQNDYMEQLLRANPSLSPDEADQQAVQKFPMKGVTDIQSLGSPGAAPTAAAGTGQSVGRFKVIQVK